jgi:very-short-patch-repair endonuclease
MSALSVINEIAERQLGLALVSEVLTNGVTVEQVRHLAARNHIDRVTPRVLRARGAPQTEMQRLLVAVLDAGPGAFSSGHTSAALWRVPGYRLFPAHVVRPRGVTGRRSSLAVLHEVKGLLPQHVTMLDGIPVVRPERMVLDLCASEHPARAARALDDAWRRHLLSGPSLRTLVGETSVQGRPGLGVLRALLDERGDDYIPPASNLERRFASIVAEAGLPEMRRQVDSGGARWVGRVDFRDVRLPLIIEVQSERYHTALTDAVADAARLEALRAAGFVVVEVWDRDVWHRPRHVERQVREARARLAVASNPAR